MMPAERQRRARPKPGTKSKAPVDRRARARRNTGHTGGRNAGPAHMDLWQTIATAEDGTPVNMIDRACEVMEHGGMVKDAAARLGVRVENYRAWLTHGARVARQLATGEITDDDLADHDRQRMELEYRTWQAEYVGRMNKIAALDRVMLGVERVREVVKVDETGKVLERSTTTETALPDTRTIMWWLQVRYPDEFRQRVSVEGPDGGPVVDLTAPMEQLRGLLGRLADGAAARRALPIPEADTNGNGHHQETTT